MSPHSGDQSSDRKIEANTNDELTLDKETLKDLDAPPGADVAGQLGVRPETFGCVTNSCFTCLVCPIPVAKA